MKCLEFRLPSGAAGMAAGMTKSSIGTKLKELVDKKLISNYRGYTQGHRHYVWFENDYDYTAFFLVWDFSKIWHRPEIIEKDYPEDWGPNPWVQSEKKT